MHIAGFARSLVLIALSAAVAGCGGGSSYTPSSATSTYPSYAPTSAAAETYETDTYAAETFETRTYRNEPVPSQEPVISLPAGRVPPQVVGRWSGGVGDKTGEYLIIESDGSYARGRNGQTPYRLGVIVSSGTDFTTYDADGARRAGQWDYTNAAGIQVLSVLFDGDYYSYAQ